MSAITIIDQYATLGGGQMVLLHLVGVLINRGHQVTVLFPRGGELEAALRIRYGDTVQYAHLNTFKLRQGKKGFLDYLKITFSPLLLLPHLGRLRRSALVYVNGGRLFLAWWALNQFFRTPSIYHVHLEHREIEKKFIRRLANSPRNRIICASEFVAARLAPIRPPRKSGGTLQTVTNALGPELSALAFTFRSSRNVAVIGRLSREKGQETIVALAPRFPATTFYLLGDADFAEADFARRLRTQSPANVVFLGKIANLVEAFDRYRITFSIVPSRCDEAFGLAAIEGMALSCVTLLRNRGELPTIAARTGAILFESDAELAQHLDNLLQQSDHELEALAHRQYRNTQRDYAFSRFAAEIAAACDKQLAFRAGS